MEDYSGIPEEILEMETGQIENSTQSSSSTSETNSMMLVAASLIILIIVVTMTLIRSIKRKGRRAKSMSVIKQEIIRNEQKTKEKEDKKRRKIEENKIKRPMGVPEDTCDFELNQQEITRNKQTTKKTKKTIRNSEAANSFEVNILEDAISTEIDDSLFGVYEKSLYEDSDTEVNDSILKDSLAGEDLAQTIKEYDEEENKIVNDFFEMKESATLFEPEEVLREQENIKLDKQQENYIEEVINPEPPKAIDSKEMNSAPLSIATVNTENTENIKDNVNTKEVAEGHIENHVVSYVNDYTDTCTEEVDSMCIIGNVQEALEALEKCRGISTVVNKVKINDEEEDLPVDVLKGSKVTVTFRTKFDFDFNADIEVDSINCSEVVIVPELVLTEDGKKKMIKITFNAPGDMRMDNIHAKIENDMSNIAKGKVKLITHLVIAV